jgi:nucleoside phosphorylase
VDVRQLGASGQAAENLLVVAALRFESISSKQWHTVVTGAGPERARSGLEAVLNRIHPDHILAVGLCGGLNPVDAIGAYAIPTELVAGYDYGVYACAPWPGITAQGRLVSVCKLAATPEEKARLREQHNARWVDMETFAWASVAAAQGIPLTVIRVIVDGARDYIPSWQVRKSWGSALTLAMHALLARRRLRAIAPRILCVR